MIAKLIDVNVSLSRWPFRRLAEDEPSALRKKLRENGVTQAWAGSFDALLHKDIAGANARLVEDCAEGRGDLLLPFGAVNPMFPDWEEDLRRCAEDWQMPGIRLHPNYHGYKLDSPQFLALLRAAAQASLIVQISVQLEDERMMHPLLRVPMVDLAPLPAALDAHPEVRVVILNALKGPSMDLIKPCAQAGAFFDIGMVEGVGGIANMREPLGIDRLLFGSHAPLFYPESAVLKLKESTLSDPELALITHDTAKSLLNSRTYE